MENKDKIITKKTTISKTEAQFTEKYDKYAEGVSFTKGNETLIVEDVEEVKSLYEHYKNTPKKLKIICDWDEVIQPCEPYALWKTINSLSTDFLKKFQGENFSDFFEMFWKIEAKDNLQIYYTPYGSGMKLISYPDCDVENVNEKQKGIKNSSNFYQQAPFLTIAKDLLKLIKEDKVEKLIFLSAYDKRKFPKGDLRKIKIFEETFKRPLANFVSTAKDGENVKFIHRVEMKLLPFDSETRKKTKTEEKLDELLKKYKVFKEDDNLVEKVYQAQVLISNNKDLDENDKQLLEQLKKEVLEEEDEQSKNTWIRKNAWDYDIFIDDNPKICEEMVKYGNGQTEYCFGCLNQSFHNRSRQPNNIRGCDGCFRSVVIAPYYPAVENQHHSEVLLVKNEVSDLKKEDFN